LVSAWQKFIVTQMLVSAMIDFVVIKYVLYSAWLKCAIIEKVGFNPG
jgi:hypothetical protein